MLKRGDMVFVRYVPTTDGAMLPMNRSPLGIVIAQHQHPADTKGQGSYMYRVIHTGGFDWYNECWLLLVELA